MADDAPIDNNFAQPEKRLDKYQHAVNNPGNNLSQESHNAKIRWIQEIHLKRIQGVALDNDDIKFLISMNTSMGNEEYARLIQLSTEALDLQTDALSGQLDTNDFLKMKLGINQQRIHLFKAKNQGAKDNALERKADLQAINAYADLAKKKGYPSIDGTPDTRVVDSTSTEDTVVEGDGKDDD